MRQGLSRRRVSQKANRGGEGAPRASPIATGFQRRSQMVMSEREGAIEIDGATQGTACVLMNPGVFQNQAERKVTRRIEGVIPDPGFRGIASRVPVSCRRRVFVRRGLRLLLFGIGRGILDR